MNRKENKEFRAQLKEQEKLMFDFFKSMPKIADELNDGKLGILAWGSTEDAVTKYRPTARPGSERFFWEMLYAIVEGVKNGDDELRHICHFLHMKENVPMPWIIYDSVFDLIELAKAFIPEPLPYRDSLGKCKTYGEYCNEFSEKLKAD
jgi:hypothetical protein